MILMRGLAISGSRGFLIEEMVNWKGHLSGIKVSRIVF